MQLLEYLDTVISVICGVGSIVMFFLAKKEKDKCVEIKNTIDQSIKIINENSSIKSKDTFNIDNVQTFDNRKSIK